jgi:hypothetical protein
MTGSVKNAIVAAPREAVDEFARFQSAPRRTGARTRRWNNKHGGCKHPPYWLNTHEFSYGLAQLLPYRRAADRS